MFMLLTTKDLPETAEYCGLIVSFYWLGVLIWLCLYWFGEGGGFYSNVAKFRGSVTFKRG